MGLVAVILLIIIYVAFISLGLPDSLLGVSWPVMQVEWSLSTDTLGIVSMLVVCSTIISSLLSGKLVKKLGTGKLVFISCLMTGGALLGISFAPSFYWILLLAIPLGFGAGSVDASLNNYVANNYKAHHMNWLHSFWGVGATLGPIIMSQFLLTAISWRGGYKAIGIIQLSLAVILCISLPLWKKQQNNINQSNEDTQMQVDEKKNVFKIKGVPFALATLVLYCTVESAVGLWGSSYLVLIKGIAVERAASWIATYFAGITIGRFLCGFISFRLSNAQLIRAGVIVALIGTALFCLPLNGNILIVPLMLIGLGLSSIFPAMIHETPTRFGKENSQKIIGFQMAFAYIGVAFFTPGLGVIMENTSMKLLPIFLVGIVILMGFCTETLNRIFKKKQRKTN